MNSRFGLAAVAVFLATNATADQLALRMNTSPSAEQIGHVFVAGCEPKLSPLMETSFELYKTAFGWDAVDAGTEAAFSPSDSDLTVTFDSSYAGATCEMTVPSAISGDGFAIYEGLLAHLEAEVSALPSAEAIDGGLKWEWQREGALSTTLTVEFIETGEGHTLRSQTTN